MRGLLLLVLGSVVAVSEGHRQLLSARNSPSFRMLKKDDSKSSGSSSDSGSGSSKGKKEKKVKGRGKDHGPDKRKFKVKVKNDEIDLECTSLSDVIRDKLELKIKTKKGDKEGAVFEVKYSFDNHTKSTKTKVKTSTTFRVDFMSVVEFEPAAGASGSDGYDFNNSKVVKTMSLNDWDNIVTLAGPNPVGTNSFQVTSKDNVVALRATIGEETAGLDPNYLKIDVNITGWTYAKDSGSFLAIVADVRSDTKIKTKVKGEKTSVLKVDLEDDGDANLPFGRFSWINSAVVPGTALANGTVVAETELVVVATSKEAPNDGKDHKERGVAFTFNDHGKRPHQIVWDPEVGSGYGEPQTAGVNGGSALGHGAGLTAAAAALVALCALRW